MTVTRRGSARVTLPSDREILITREFGAPAELVFRAWTTPDLVRRWWGWESSPLVVCEIDLRPGGDWRYVTRDADGTELTWHGTYLEIDAPRRLVSTEVFGANVDGGVQNILTLTERDAVTVLEVTVVHRSKQHRDGHVASGMERGLQNSLDRLDELIARPLTEGEHR
jgi:uncharacterized protein YndB with AHSA1/START domain